MKIKDARDLELDRLNAENVKLRAALKPFAAAASTWDGEPESLCVELAAYDDKPSPCVNVGDFRAARDADQ